MIIRGFYGVTIVIIFIMEKKMETIGIMSVWGQARQGKP